MNNKSQTINNYKTVSVFNVTGGLYRRRRLLISLDAYSSFILNLLVVSVLIFVLSVMVFNQHMLPSYLKSQLITGMYWSCLYYIHFYKFDVRGESHMSFRSNQNHKMCKQSQQSLMQHTFFKSQRVWETSVSEVILPIRQRIIV